METEKKMSVAEVAHLECVPVCPFHLLVAIILDLEAAVGHECLKLTWGEPNPKRGKVLNLQERVQSLRPSGRRLRGPRRGPSPQAKGLQGHREVWRPRVTSPERSRSKPKFRIGKLRGHKGPGPLAGWLRAGAQENPRPSGRRPRARVQLNTSGLERSQFSQVCCILASHERQIYTIT